jgi:allophanate hydrolase subunit 2
VEPVLQPEIGPPLGFLRVVPGPQADWFDLSAFLAAEYRVTPASDRMGVRLSGPPLVRRPGEIASEPVAPGAVQATNDGQCIVLGTDGQTIGGYPKVAHVVRADLDALGQLRPGESVRFARVTVEEAEMLDARRRAVLHEWLTRLRAADGGFEPHLTD